VKINRSAIGRAGPGDIPGLARLLWLDTRHEVPDADAVAEFAIELEEWWRGKRDSHIAFVARTEDATAAQEIVGMAWVALLPRIPRPGATNRLAGDIQTVFVLPEHRSRGIGSALVDAAAQHATDRGAIRVTVHSGRRAIPVYERIGFASSRQLLQRPPE
jgi:GNAT superfamily N-acetyltransferase